MRLDLVLEHEQSFLFQVIIASFMTVVDSPPPGLFLFVCLFDLQLFV